MPQSPFSWTPVGVKKTNKFPVKLLVVHQRTPQFYQTIYDLSQQEFDSFSASRISNKLQRVRNNIKLIKREAGTIINKLQSFSFKDFEQEYILDNPLFRQRKYLKEKPIQIDPFKDFDYTPYHQRYPILYEHFEIGTIGYSYFTYIKSLLKMGRIGTASSYQCSFISLKKFGGNVTFATITVEYLRRYELWLKSKDLSKSTIGIYIRPLRAIFNEAAIAKIINKEKCYPFGKRKYLIPSSRNIKKSLELSHVEKIYYYLPTCESEWKARDLWLFLYFANGINPKDMALLRYRNIEDGYISFDRSKTEWTMRNDIRPITFFLSDDIKGIIERWGNRNNHPDNYIFPILEPGITPLKEYKLIQQLTQFINNWMKKIKNALGIDKKITTSVARHTFSTILKRAGASTEFIQESLGHTTSRTTENYLDSFEKETKKEFSGKLTSFKKEGMEDKTKTELNLKSANNIY